jgi:hypothetical protein
MQALLEKALEEIDSATEGMTEEQLLFHHEGKWSSAQILEHLSMAFGHTIRGLNRCLEAGKMLGDRPNLKQRIFHLIVLDLQHFPTGRNAPAMVVPTGRLGGKEAVNAIRNNLIEMDKNLTECKAKLGNKGYLLNHPVLGPLTPANWMTFHFVHTRHHMKQIRALRAEQNQSAIIKS